MLNLPQFIPTTEAGVLPCVGQYDLYDHPDTAAQAAELCAACPVREACDTWAVEHAEWGTWAGRTDEDRGTPRRELPDTPTLPAIPGPDCGTDTQWRRHNGLQQRCEVCDAARAERIRAARVERLAAEHAKPAGPSREGYRLHLHLGIEPCPPCLAAHSRKVLLAVRGGQRAA